MANARPPRLRLFDILDAIAGVERLLNAADSADRSTSADEYRAMERYIEIISEASRGIPDEIKASEPDIPWRAIADIGNMIRHAYHRIDPSNLEDIARGDIPTLKAAVERLYTSAKKPSDPWP